MKSKNKNLNNNEKRKESIIKRSINSLKNIFQKPKKQ